MLITFLLLSLVAATNRRRRGERRGSFNPFPKRPSENCLVNTARGKTCHEILARDPHNAKNGYYKIHLPDQPAPVIVECFFEDGRGWTVIQKRTTGHLKFNKSWREYKNGFQSVMKRKGNGVDQCHIYCSPGLEQKERSRLFFHFSNFSIFPDYFQFLSKFFSIPNYSGLTKFLPISCRFSIRLLSFVAEFISRSLFYRSGLIPSQIFPVTCPTPLYCQT